MFGTLVIERTMTDQEKQLDELFTYLDSPEFSVREAARQRLAAYSLDSIQGRLIASIQQHRGYQSYESAQLFLEHMDCIDDRLLHDMLTSSHPMIGHLVFEYLERNRCNTTTQTLLKALPYAIPTVQMRIIGYIRQQQGQEALHTLIAVLRYTHSISVQTQVMDALAALGDNRAVVFIQPFTQHMNPHVRTAAREAVMMLTLQ